MARLDTEKMQKLIEMTNAKGFRSAAKPIRKFAGSSAGQASIAGVAVLGAAALLLSNRKVRDAMKEGARTACSGIAGAFTVLGDRLGTQAVTEKEALASSPLPPGAVKDKGVSIAS